ncbi:MAG: septal ring lytic transglycosylase RlpA family protein [Bacteroidota bacterium]
MPIKLRSFFSTGTLKRCCFLILFLFVQFFAPAQKKKEPLKLNTGIASWYSDNFNGRRTASGEIFSQKKLTCASNQYKMGTWLKVTNVKNGKSVVVKVNDRMSPRMKRIVDLTRAAAKQIGILGSGLSRVSVERLGSKHPK